MILKTLNMSNNIIQEGDTGKIVSTDHISMITKRPFSKILMDKNGTTRYLYNRDLIKV